MRVLVIGKVWPEPASSAAGGRTLSLLRAMTHEGWIVTFASSAQPSPFSVNLEELGVATKTVAPNTDAFDRWVTELNPELVLFDRFMTEEQFGWRIEKACPDALRVLDTSDLHCLRAARQIQLKQGGRIDFQNDTALREIASIFRSDFSFMISEYEIEVLRTIYQVPESLLGYLPLMLPPPLSDSPSFESRANFIMIGNYYHEPNWDAVQWCCESIWPKIHHQLPEAELHLYGAYEPAKVRQLANPRGGIVSKGRAKNALSEMVKYRVNLAPLRFGAGQKGKVADGFCSGTPNVVTPIAAESMHGSIDWGCPISDDLEVFSDTAVQVYRDEAVWIRVREAGYRILRARLSYRDWRPRFIEMLRSLNLDCRENNFTGAMLRHHLHRSTEYMSRWIEAKNRVIEPS